MRRKDKMEVEKKKRRGCGCSPIISIVFLIAVAAVALFVIIESQNGGYPLVTKYDNNHATYRVTGAVCDKLTDSTRVTLDVNVISVRDEGIELPRAADVVTSGDQFYKAENGGWTIDFVQGNSSVNSQFLFFINERLNGLEDGVVQIDAEPASDQPPFTELKFLGMECNA